MLVASPIVFFIEHLPARIYFTLSFSLSLLLSNLSNTKSKFLKNVCFLFYHISFGKDVYIHFAVTQSQTNKWTGVCHNKHLLWGCSLSKVHIYTALCLFKLHPADFLCLLVSLYLISSIQSFLPCGLRSGSNIFCSTLSNWSWLCDFSISASSEEATSC